MTQKPCFANSLVLCIASKTIVLNKQVNAGARFQFVGALNDGGRAEDFLECIPHNNYLRFFKKFTVCGRRICCSSIVLLNRIENFWRKRPFLERHLFCAA